MRFVCYGRLVNFLDISKSRLDASPSGETVYIVTIDLREGGREVCSFVC